MDDKQIEAGLKLCEAVDTYFDPPQVEYGIERTHNRIGEEQFEEVFDLVAYLPQREHWECADSVADFGATSHPNNEARAKLAEFAFTNLGAALTALRDTRAALAELVKQWQPIETAPKDGTRILLCHRGLNDIGIVLEGYYCEDEGWYESNTHPTDATDGRCDPTHWMKLPDPPDGTKITGAGVEAPASLNTPS